VPEKGSNGAFLKKIIKNDTNSSVSIVDRRFIDND
jgi:hypothetical protein